MNPVQQIIDSVDDALVRIRYDKKLDSFDDTMLQVSSWHQIWPNTSCGRGGISGQAITYAQTVIIQHIGYEYGLYVYHQGKFCYKLNIDDHRTRSIAEKFVSNHAFPGLDAIIHEERYNFISYDLPHIK